MATVELTLKSLEGAGPSRLVPGLRRLRRAEVAEGGHRRAGHPAARGPRRLRHRLLVEPAGVHPRLRRPQPARPRAARGHRGRAGQPRPARRRGGRRRRRLRHRHGHFIHAMRRNLNLTYIVMDNEVYGLTTGQASPTTDRGAQDQEHAPRQRREARSTPRARHLATGATYVARGSRQQKQLTKLIAGAIAHRGFSLIDVFSPCVTFNKVNTYPWFKERVYKLEDGALRPDRPHGGDGEVDGMGLADPDRAPLSDTRSPPTKTASPYFGEGSARRSADRHRPPDLRPDPGGDDVGPGHGPRRYATALKNV